MRLIDADKLIKQLKEGFDDSDVYTDKDQFIIDCIHLLENAPTVEPERPQCNQIAWEQGYECGFAQAKEGVIIRIVKQYSEHNELIPEWLSVGDMKGSAE